MAIQEEPEGPTLGAQLAFADARIRELGVERNRLVDECNKAQAAMQISEEEVSRLRDQLRRQDNELVTLRGALSQAEKDMETLQAVLDSRPFQESDTQKWQECVEGRDLEIARHKRTIEALKAKQVYLRDFIKSQKLGMVHGDPPPPKPKAPEPEETILEEAARIVDGERQGAYGHPFHAYRALAEVWTWFLKNRFDLRDDDWRVHLSQEDCCFMLSLMKFSREITGHGKRDNLVDGAGYLRCVEMIKARRGVESYRG